MPDRNDETPRKEVWGSAQGVIKKGSLVRDAEGISAIIIGEHEDELRITGSEDRFSAIIEAAAERGEPVILQGHLLGSRANGTAHLAVRIGGPIELTGVISDVRRSREGGPPHVGFWLMREISSAEGKTHFIGTGVNVYGDDAMSLLGLREGDRVAVQARHGTDGFIATSPVGVLAADGPDVPAM